MDLSNCHELGLADLRELCLPWDINNAKRDHILFIKHSSSGTIIALLVYVADIVATGDDDKEKEMLRLRLAK